MWSTWEQHVCCGVYVCFSMWGKLLSALSFVKYTAIDVGKKKTQRSVSDEYEIVLCIKCSWILCDEMFKLFSLFQQRRTWKGLKCFKRNTIFVSWKLEEVLENWMNFRQTLNSLRKFLKAEEFSKIWSIFSLKETP